MKSRRRYNKKKVRIEKKDKTLVERVEVDF